MEETGSQHENASALMPGALYVVATPLGNLGDISPRALAVLRGADRIAAEDTRHTQQLLNRFGIRARLMAAHEHNEARAAQAVLDRLAAGETVALVSDAGTPAVSDPGARIVAAAHEAGHRVVPVPGPSALAAALSAAGIDAPHFLFYGFLPASAAARRREVEALRPLPYALVFYEAPHRIAETVADLAAGLEGGRVAVLARELTKMFETVHRARLDALPEWLDGDDNRRRGEFVVCIGPPPPAKNDALDADAERALRLLLAELPLKQAVKLATEISGAAKNALYARALEMKAEAGREG